jgi:hypothetical protein
LIDQYDSELSVEARDESAAPIFEDSLEIPPNEQCVGDPPAGDLVVDSIDYFCKSIDLPEPMLVNPNAIRAAALLVDESDRRFPGRDHGLPANRETAEPKAVVDQRTLKHGDGQGRLYTKSEVWRRNQVEVAGIGKELKHRIDRGGNAGDALESIAPSLLCDRTALSMFWHFE